MNTKVENMTVQTMRSGFTLIEILVAVAIIGILATVATLSIGDNLDSSKETAAQTSVRTLDEGIASYKIKHPGKNFTSLEQLIEGDENNAPVIKGGEDVLIDPWGNPYEFERRGKMYAVISCGPDGEKGTEDDIRSDKVKSKAKADK